MTDNDTAQAQADEVRQAYAAASRPNLARGWCAVSALCAGAGVALLSQGRPGWVHLISLCAGVLLMATAHVLPAALRRQRGLRGYRGWTKTENAIFLLCASALVICGLNATRELSWIFIGLGVVSAVAWYAMLRGVLVMGGRSPV